MTDEACAGHRITNPVKRRQAELGRRFAPASLRAAAWTALALRRARRSLKVNGLQTVVGPPPSLPWKATTGVYGVLRRQPHTCLERALVLQAWLAAQGERHEVLVGAARNEGTFAAHAWLDYEVREAERYEQLLRIPPPPQRATPTA